MKSKRQQFIEAMRLPTVEVSTIEDGETVKAEAMLICPGCGARYRLKTAPPFCLLPRCEYPFTGKTTEVRAEQDLSKQRLAPVSRYVMV